MNVARYPEVSVGQELLNISLAVFNDNRILIHPDKNSDGHFWKWEGLSVYDPALIIMARDVDMKRSIATKDSGRIVVLDAAVMVVIDDMMEYEVKLERKNLAKIPDDPYMLDILSAFRQYEIHPLM